MKIAPILLRYDYGLKSRGDSLEYKGFYPSLKEITNEVYPFWYDEYLDKREELQKEVIKFVDDIKPDVLFFVLYKGAFDFATLDYLKSKYITINWFCDDHWRFDGFTKYQAPHFTYSITTDKFALNKYKKMHYKNVILSQWASFGSSKDIDFEAIKYNYDISFVGGISGYRKWLVEQLKEAGINVECFGAGWKNGRVSYEEMVKILKTSKINLNISNSVSFDIRYVLSSERSQQEFMRSAKRIEQLKARNFEIPAFGGFQLTNYTPSLENYFNIGSEVAVYMSIDDLILQIKYYLDNEEERKQITINGYKRAINEHTYLNRLKDIFKKVEFKKKATLYTSPFYLNNRQFDMSDEISNRDDCLYGFYLLKKRLEEKGIDLSTQDINPPSESQFIIYNEMPKIIGNFPDKDKYLIIFESEVVRPDNWHKGYHKHFKKIFTWNDKWVDNKKYIKFYWFNKIIQNLEIHKKTKFCAMIVGNKSKSHPLELYSERRKTIRWFEKNHPEDFDLYGIGWNKSQYPSYRGVVKSKREVLQKYKFSICYENVKELTGYITEKIFDCFFAGCVPVYWGASNITDYIPADTFIDRRKFKNHLELYNYLKNMSEEEYTDYLYALGSFVESEKIYPFSAEYFAETIVSEIEE